MKYKGFYITQYDDNNILRETAEGLKRCEGLCFQVYLDSSFDYEIDNFFGAFGIEIQNSEEDIERFIKERVDENLYDYKKAKLYVVLNNDYKAFEHDVRYCSEEYNPFDDAEKISNMKKSHELLMNHRPNISESSIDYLLTLKRPLETVCEIFKHNDIAFLESLNAAVDEIAENKINIFGELDEADDEELEM